MKRRNFLKKSLYTSLAAGGLFSSGGMLQLINAAAAQNISNRGDADYKALVCVFMDGGNDSANMIVPRGISEYQAYAGVRGDLALPQSDLLAINDPINNGGRSWGLHPELPGLQNLFNNNTAAVVGNVGSLAYPITQQEFNNNSVPKPPNLFSHIDQKNQWQTSVADAPSISGWAERIADLLHATENGGNPLSMNISLAGNNQLQVGAQISQYQMSNSGSLSLSDSGYQDAVARNNALTQLLNANNSHFFQQGYADIFNRAIDVDQIISSALLNTPNLGVTFPEQPGSNSLSAQLEMVARMISVNSTLGVNRQVFFCSVGGFDNHDNHIVDHALGMRNLNGAVSAFQQAINNLQLQQQVTLFTASDFSRTWRSNGQGSDHGWGASHFVVGGAVNGGDFYGAMPVIEPDSSDAISDHGRTIPTIAVDEYGATLARWFDVPGNQINTIFPNIGRFNSSDLGFMGS
ncbi:DUF1501 domain-containing protein [Marinicella sp. W31]|uniref:DUF1501 domain-containing protein n=1 Tax=Marinicella sp. W31 TaxID=3023713 RepID=UPI0037581F01